MTMPSQNGLRFGYALARDPPGGCSGTAVETIEKPKKDQRQSPHSYADPLRRVFRIEVLGILVGVALARSEKDWSGHMPGWPGFSLNHNRSCEMLAGKFKVGRADCCFSLVKKTKNELRALEVWSGTDVQVTRKTPVFDICARVLESSTGIGRDTSVEGALPRREQSAGCRDMFASRDRRCL